MKLSEAIRMNGMMKPQGFGAESVGAVDEPCAIGGALQIIGQQIAGNMSLNTVLFIDAWPWVLRTGFSCPAQSGCPAQLTWAASDLVWHLNDRHRWTRQQIAEWVASVEPEELAVGEAVHEQTDVRQVPIPRG